MGKPSKKGIAIIVGAIGASITTAYFAFTTNNPTLAAAVPAILTFVICPAMCAAMGGTMWFVNRSKKKAQTVLADKNIPTTESV